ncbi:MAG: hypothetical protein MnENMB40S_13410 [Rhizobiaceae bacterium MnEN-MB40S]|nr:MAG: hypothetical protein MnENMB40S_13410 [Rhizobiaceae bacterium MnEN-MB40S]
MLRMGRIEVMETLLPVPVPARDQSALSHYRMHQWELETLIIQLLFLPDAEMQTNTRGELDCSRFRTVVELINRLRKLEDVESALYLSENEFDVLNEMHRIAQRQFHWQRGYFNLPQFYRTAFIYSQGECGEYFQRTHGLPIAELNFVGFVYYAHSLRTPFTNLSNGISAIGLTTDLLDRALPLLVCKLDEARSETAALVERVNKKHGRPIPTAYLPSVLRRRPLLSLDERPYEFIAPIPEMIAMRVTSGLYYDLIPGGQGLLNEANDRFEEYSRRLISAQMERFEARRAYRYELKKGYSADTPDILVRDGNRLALVIECKATKLNYLAQFAEDPFETEKQQYLQIANAVLQLWRFFSHIRQGFIDESIDPEASAMVLTLDSFLTLSRKLKADILREANLLADKDGSIVDEDRRQVVFCSIQTLEEILSISNESEFLDTLKAARQEKYDGWEISSIYRDQSSGSRQSTQKPFPFALDDLLPWWERTSKLGSS